MKKIFSILFLYIIGTLIYSGVQISKAFTAEIPEIDENLQVVKKTKEESKKEESKVVEQNDEVKQTETKTNNNTQKQNNNQTKKIESKKQEIKTESPKEEVKQETVQQVQSEPVQQQPQVQSVEEPKPQPVQQPIYETYQGEYYSWDECKSASINVAFETDARTMCYEAYTNSNGQVVYKIQLIY